MSAIKTILISALCAVLGAGVVALATQTNYLGTVFVADTTTPTNQLKVNSDGSINAVVSGGGGSGTVTSIATGCQATGGTITTTGTISTQDQWFALSTNAIVAGDCGGTVSVGSSSDTAPTIAVSGSAGFPQWWYTYLCNAGTHSQTITPASGTIGGASTYVLGAGTVAAPSCVKITSDAANTNYKVSFAVAPAATGANPSATAGPSANNGSATTFMRSDASPAVQKGLSSQFGVVECDNVTVTCPGGVLSSVGGAATAVTVGTTLVASGTTGQYLYDSGGTLGNQALPVGSASQEGIVQVDNTTITASGGVISAVGGGSGNALFGTTTGNVANNFVTMSNTTVGVKDSGQSPSTIAAQQAFYKTGNSDWYQPVTNMVAATGVAVANSTAYCVFGNVTSQVTIKALGFRISAGVSGAAAEAAVISFGSQYAPSDTATLVDTGAAQSAFSTGTGFQTQTVANTTDILKPGILYAFCVAYNASSATAVATSFNTSSMGALQLVGSTSTTNIISGASTMIGKSFAVTYSTTPATTFNSIPALSSMTDAITAVIPQVAFEVN